MLNSLKEVLGRVGQYQGEGTNHDGQKFAGVLVLSPLLGEKGATLEFRATGHDGTLFHEERSWVGPGMSDDLGLWVVSTNHPCVMAHELRRVVPLARESGRSFVFGVGRVDDARAFREEVALDFYGNGDIGYRYFWGMPGGEFKERSVARLKRVALPEQMDLGLKAGAGGAAGEGSASVPAPCNTGAQGDEAVPTPPRTRIPDSVL